MAGSKSGGFTLEFQRDSYKNMELQMDKLRKLAPKETMKGIITLLFDMKGLAQMKLKSDKHIDTSRLRNSIYVQTLGQKGATRPGNEESYADKEGKAYSRTLDVQLNEFEGAIGTNVEYAQAIEFGYPPQTITAKGKTLAYRLKPGQQFTKGLFSSINWSTNLKTKKIEQSERWVILGKSVQHPGFAGDSFLHWAMKNVDTEKRWREVSKELLNGMKI